MDPKKLREELRVLLRRRPFQPFRLHLTDGRTVDAQLPDMHILGKSYIDVGFPEPNVPDPYCDESMIVYLSDIARVESLPVAAETAGSVGR